jgi:hypothetical protein
MPDRQRGPGAAPLLAFWSDNALDVSAGVLATTATAVDVIGVTTR